MKRSIVEAVVLVAIVCVWRFVSPVATHVRVEPIATPPLASHATLVTPKRIPIQYETSGADASYVHGRHCIDGRTF